MRKVWNWREVNSPPPLDCSCLILVENLFSTRSLNLTKVSKVSDLLWNGYIQLNLE